MKNVFFKYIIRIAYYILSKPYSMCVGVRNKLYDTKMLMSHKSNIPTIGIGNITVGGTGKTPHAEYLIELLKDKFQLAYLSRGYKRTTKGWRDANNGGSAKTIGDEAYQIHCKYPKITVAVCENRLKGTKNIELLHPKTDIIILDDVYQHRQILPDLNILLIDYNRLIYYDHMLPYGNLRENAKNTDRADIIIITKCPYDLLPVNCLSVRSQIGPYPYQKLLFSTIDYKDLDPIYNTSKDINIINKNIIAVSGLACSKNYINQLKTLSNKVIEVRFPDHHNYNNKSIGKITKEIELWGIENCIVVITEKDKAKFDSLKLPDVIKQRIFCLGIKIDFLFGGKQVFDKEIIQFSSKKIAEKTGER